MTPRSWFQNILEDSKCGRTLGKAADTCGTVAPFYALYAILSICNYRLSHL